MPDIQFAILNYIPYIGTVLRTRKIYKMAQYRNIFKITHNNLLPAKGSIIIAEPFLQEAYFQRSVVLLAEHNPSGSMGFVLNKKLDLKVNTFFPELKESASIPIYLGGPVSADKLFFIHTLGNTIVPNSEKLTESLYFDGDFNALKRYILNGHSIEGKVKFFLGYSGWTEDQLLNEIKQNSWVVSQESSINMLCAEGEEFWKSTLSVLGGKYKNWINYPKDPYYN